MDIQKGRFTPSSHDPIGELIRNAMDELPPELARCARWAGEHRREVALLSMRRQAELAGATPTSMTRMARALGFDEYSAFRELFQNAFAHPTPGFRDRVAAMQAIGPDGGTLTRTLELMQTEDVRSGTRHNTEDGIDRAVQLILGAETVAFLGLRSCFAMSYHFWYVYGLIARNGELVHGLGGAFPDDLGRLGSKDLLICVTQKPYGRATIEALRACKQRGVPVLTLTDSPAAPAIGYSTASLLFDARSPSFFPSMVGSLALIENLIARLAMAGGEKTLAHLAMVQGNLARDGAYWDDEQEQP
jgi:DNA-binding MurR/RpiR family transcriptional regulator